MIINSLFQIFLLTLLTSEPAVAHRGQCGVTDTREPKEPILPQSAQLLRRQDGINLGNSRQQPIKVKVQTHVLRGGGDKVNALTKESSKLWQKNLNDAFAAVRVTFEFLETKFYENPTLSSNMNVLENSMNLTDRKRPELLQIVVAENIFIPGLDFPISGVANFPWNAKNATFIDCVRMAAFGMPEHDPATLAHEVGHWLGLHHTFSFGCPAVSEGDLSKSHHGDYVRDTFMGREETNKFDGHQCNALPIPDSSKCTLVGKTTPEPYPVDNFMSYTPGQGARMHAMWAWRKDGQGPAENTLY
jgi:hypothetical protein